MTEPSSVTSSGTDIADRASPQSRWESASILSFRRAPSATLAPARAHSSAKCAPRPEDAPLTSTTLPDRLKEVLNSISSDGQSRNIAAYLHPLGRTSMRERVCQEQYALV